ncbi:LysR substrate-binding domain-containing protein [Aminobacter sp. SR38]|uniref:LysR substrate-binding domain-containing protein n=1 Tax=Aminobacter sp. SR38 TaxID=2774562 RepID=UPI001FED581E|nr:LysR substrate-binding domain-containing protein [Aminobacter sp. SR38]
MPLTGKGSPVLAVPTQPLTVTSSSWTACQRRNTLGPTNSSVPIFWRLIKRLQDAQGRPIKPASNPEIIEKLLRKEIDLAFTEWWDDRKGYQARLWRKEKLVIIVSPQHNWRTRKTIEAAELFQESLIGGERGTGTGSVLREAFGQAAEQFPISFNVGSTEAVKHAVRAGLGISEAMRSTVPMRARVL